MRPTLTAVALIAPLQFFIPLSAVPAQAQEGEDAESLIRQGVQLRRKGDNAKAHGYFKRAYEISHTPRATAQLGLVEQALDKLVDAESHLSEALSASDAWVDEHREVLQKSLNVIRGVLGRIQVRSKTGAAPAGTTVQVDSRPATRLPSDGVIWSSPGAHVLRIQSPALADITRPVTTSEGTVVAVDVDFPSGAPPPPVAGRAATISVADGVPRSDGLPSPGLSQLPSGQDVPSGKANWKAPAKWITGGAALLSLGFGLTETLVFNSKVHAFNDTKDPTDPAGKRLLCSEDAGVISGGPTCTRINSDEATALKWAIVGYSVGGALAIASTVLFLTDRKSTSDQAALRCGPGVSESSRVVCQFRF